MNNLFISSSRSLEEKSSIHNLLWLISIGLLLIGWFYWFLFAQIDVFRHSQDANIHNTGNHFDISTTINGKIDFISPKLQGLKANVKKGDLLLSISHTKIKLENTYFSQKHKNLNEQLSTLDKELFLLVKVHKSKLSTTQSSINNTQKKLHHANQLISLQSNVVAKYKRLYEEQKNSELQFLDAQKKLIEKKSIALSLSEELQKLNSNMSILLDKNEQVELIMQQRMQNIHLEISQNKLAIEQSDDEKSKYNILAPVDGYLDAFSKINLGEYVEKGLKLGRIVPVEQVLVEAIFLPSDAIGRIKKGQRARIKVQGYPWTQYGSIDSRVISVSSAIHNETIRVQLELFPSQHSTIPLLQDLKASVEVNTEQTTPFDLLLKSIGLWLNFNKAN
jgi:membrane fusion protein (multidrug efflux system)